MSHLNFQGNPQVPSFKAKFSFLSGFLVKNHDDSPDIRKVLWSSQSYLEYEILYIDHICIGKATLETTTSTVHRGVI